MWNTWQSQPLWLKVLIGLGLGLITGLVIPQWLAVEIKIIGDLFIRAIKMLIVPLIFVSLVTGVTAMSDMGRMGRIGLKTMGIYLFTTAIAVSVGLLFANIFAPGVGAPTGSLGDPQALEKTVSVKDLLTNIIPTNPIDALAQTNVLQIIFFALLTGLAINAVGEKAGPVRSFFISAADIIYKITDWVMQTAPYGVFGLIAWVVGTQGLDILAPLAQLILTLYAACIAHMGIVLTIFLVLIARLNVWRFLKGIRDAQLVAYSTSTSSGTLPVSMRCVESHLGVSRPVSSFVLPLGATMNMDGTAIYMGIAAIFVSQAFGVDLTFTNYATIVLTGTLASIGAAGVPSAGLILIPMVLSSVGLPIEAVALFAGVDRILDMMRTATNVTGDCMVATVVAKSEGELDMDVFRSGEAREPASA
ncbi:MAG: dicarboxylate/amino acid:cation symporter [Pseudomonadota bacterium]